MDGRNEIEIEIERQTGVHDLIKHAFALELMDDTHLLIELERKRVQMQTTPERTRHTYI